MITPDKSSPKQDSRSEHILEFVDMHFAYRRGEPVVRGVSAAVKRGQFVSLLGPNGSGKTTLLRLALRQLQPSGGHVLLSGRPLHAYHVRRLARLVGYVPQQSEAVFAFTVAQTVMLGRGPHTGLFGFEREQDLEIVRAALEATDTQSLANRTLAQLSGGERQRVIIARALAQRPQLLLLDEPTSWLDLRHQVTIYGLLRQLTREQGVTVLSVTHDINLAAQFSDQLVLLGNGKVLAQGMPTEVVTPQNIEAAYHAQVDVLKHPRSGQPSVLLSDRTAETDPGS